MSGCGKSKILWACNVLDRADTTEAEGNEEVQEAGLPLRIPWESPRSCSAKLGGDQTYAHSSCFSRHAARGTSIVHACFSAPPRLPITTTTLNTSNTSGEPDLKGRSWVLGLRSWV